MAVYQSIMIASWAVFIVVWAVSALNVKRDIRGGYSSLWKGYYVFRLLALAFLVWFATRVATGAARFTNPGIMFDRGIFASAFVAPLAVDWIGALLSALGVAFAIWARFSLGRNWSPRPAVKERHELVTSGPYAYVRHPIYAGLIVAALGVTLTGTFFGIVVLIIALIIFLSRFKKEERIMLELFPDEYPEYRKRTRALIPFLW